MELLLVNLGRILVPGITLALVPEDPFNNANLLRKLSALEGCLIQVSVLLPTADGRTTNCTRDQSNLYVFVGLSHLDTESATEADPGDFFIKRNGVHGGHPFVSLVEH